ncbi:beta-ketoacyl-ACP synthase [Sediminicoccus sp. KRV36]|uniref:beta-ketoacyl-ACP synthase n=1 Tax=Sediminicoccus sp. KRV36 TaxID=3133721 RepID=UPI0020101D01|nr:beta-ketoacyl-ACP synthase [Sediminicoccus rosea]UPY34981.1 beta-ketoacyl-ACP synthase [Sediminicoccus rosea]
MLRPVAITGIGLASSHGEGRAVHTALLGGAAPVLDEARFAPYAVHPLAPLPFDAAIPRREMRQMENWQRLGVYAAGLAIDDGGLRDRVAAMDLIVAAGGGERDWKLDEQIMSAHPAEIERHRMLMDGLRPTLFLAQLSNLMAGSISIVHNVAGSSRTLLGEEIAGAEALRIAAARVATGTSELSLAGGAFIAERPEILLLFAMGGMLHSGPWAPVAARQGIVFGSVGAFLTLGPAGAAKPLAILRHIATDQGPPEGRASRFAALLAATPARAPDCLVISAASGAADATRAELAALPTPPEIFAADLLGHSTEAAFPAALALATLAIQSGRARQVLVTGAGQWRGEAVALLEAPL